MDQTISINDLLYCIGPCSHCGQSAKEDEALDAFNQWKEWLVELPSCAICGGAVPVTEVVLAHKVVEESPEVLAWRVRYVVFDDCLAFVGAKGVEVSMHGDCAREALPKADWKSLGIVCHHQEGRRRMPWDDGFREWIHGTR